ncbi:hypothetical protein ABZ735_37175 [Streptomyces longwoodensis]
MRHHQLRRLPARGPGRDEGGFAGSRSGRGDGRNGSTGPTEGRGGRHRSTGARAPVDERVEQVFTEAYRDTAREFEGMFSRLFPGGEGRLALTDPDHMITTGVPAGAEACEQPGPADRPVPEAAFCRGART